MDNLQAHPFIYVITIMVLVIGRIVIVKMKTDRDIKITEIIFGKSNDRNTSSK